MIRFLQPVPADLRGSDPWGSGHFGAPRGDRYHAGADFLVPAGRMVVSPITGTVVRRGKPYSDEPTFDLVEIEAEDGVLWRLFYLWPFFQPGDRVFRGIMLGQAQDLAVRFSDSERGDMPNHIHVEAIVDGEKVDPVPLLMMLEEGFAE